MSREFWIRDQHLNFGPDIKGSKFIAFESNDVEGKDIIHVREVDPEYDKAVEGLVEAFDSLLEIYPESVFTGVSGDNGVLKVVKARNSIEAFKKVSGK